MNSPAPGALPHPPVIVGLGEVLWDVFDDAAHFGGAPANFACHAAAFGAQACMASGIGADPLGQQALATLRDDGVDVAAVACVPHAPTGTVRVRVDAQGLPHYLVARDVAWDRIPWTPALAQLAARADAVCFGVIAQRSPISRRTIHRFLDATRPHCLRVFDVNLRQDDFNRPLVERSLHKTTVLKLNEEELAVFADLFALRGATDALKMTQLLERFALHLVILTLGARGATLQDRTQTVTVAAEPVQVVDTVGAGDAFTATITLGLLAGCDLRAIAAHACRVAGYVCAHQGAVPQLPPALRTLPAPPLPKTGT